VRPAFVDAGFTSIAARTPRIVTTRTSLFDEAGCHQGNTISEKTKEIYFRADGWTGDIRLNGRALLAFWRELIWRRFVRAGAMSLRGALS
jgi:hypothetical protein